MKDFFKYVLATIVGIVILGLIMAILSVMSLVGMVASGEATKNVSDNSVLVMELKGSMEEMSIGAQKINECGTTLGDVSGKMSDSIKAIGSQIDQFKV